MTVKYAGFCISATENIPATDASLLLMLKDLSSVYDRNHDVKSSTVGYHTLGSIMGNGRFRDMGYSAESVVDIIRSLNPKTFPLLFKRHNGKGDLFLHREPIFHTKALYKTLVEIKKDGKLKKDSNGKLKIHFRGKIYDGHGVKESVFKAKTEI